VCKFYLKVFYLLKKLLLLRQFKTTPMVIAAKAGIRADTGPGANLPRTRSGVRHDGSALVHYRVNPVRLRQCHRRDTVT
jgi:hypothetical protein